MTYGSCQSRCESNVHTWVKPNSSACRANSTTRAAGGSVCRTTPKSISDQVLREPTLDELAVSGAADVPGLVLDDGAARQHHVDMPVDLEALPRRVVHVHVVRLSDADRGVPVGVVDDDVGVRARSEHALAAGQPEHPRRRRAAQLHPALLADPPVA